ncbi:hypothetical protein BDZ94DRAFT_1243052 [Collybia nuda]|uniref:Uncharacterized protein n=1 Tax=Collybia nuda TaxID=64659 RepID=A0A9P5YGX5_9AGAR|nr:hypothetical protein BDZ94DRAFT_1243052 [Collybia nuda]
MLVLSTLHNLLSQVLYLPHLHTAILFTPAGQLVSVATDAARPKDEIRVVVGLAGEIWQETRQQGFGMVDSELGRIMVLPVDEVPQEPVQSQPPLQISEGEDHQPLMLLALNSTAAVDWEELQTKGRVLASHLAKPLSRYREYLAIARPVLPTSTTTSPPPRS